MTEKYIASLDLGTSSCRAAAVTPGGRILCQKSVPLAPERRAAGLSEYDTETLFASQLSALHAVLEAAGPQNAAAVAVASQRSTVVLWDKSSSRAVAPVLTWEDGRAAQEAQACAFSQEEIHAVTGLYKTPYFSAPKIAWCLKNCPPAQKALQAGTLAVAPAASYFIWRLTRGAVFSCDPTLAQRTLLFDVNAKNWSGALCKAFGVPVEALPTVLPSGADYGFYEYKGVKIPIRACAGDQQAAAYAMGLTPGKCSINYGTGAFLLYNAGREAKRLPGILTSLSVSEDSLDGDLLLEGPVNAAGSVFMWLNACGLPLETAELDGLAQKSDRPVWLLPALGGLGAPYWDFSVSPVISGLSPLTKKADVAAGAVRGVAFSVADVVYYLRKFGLESAQISVSGGLSRLTSLLQFQADILQKELTVLEESESTLLGAARLAARRLGVSTEWAFPPVKRMVSPAIFGVEADKEYQNWRKFVEWCQAKPAL
uniref:Glycerol kinase n=1 Tax=uncultured Elusimicrobia bacterium TaxID=699876 RepID=A0A650EM10_9BACT|nr:glycerol kinase [uncultured Elusimicrobia bacterium]